MLNINRNKSVVINNTDKNVGRAFADSLTREESRQQFYDKFVYLFLYERHVKILLKNTTMPFLKRGTCSQRKSRFYPFEVEHYSSFYVIWNPVIDKTDHSWVQLDKNSIFDIHRALFNEILQQVWLDFIRLNKV